MRRALALVVALLVGCTDNEPADTDTDTDTDTPIEAGTETVSTTWDVDMFSQYPSPTIPMFDTLGGRRQLDGMTIAVDHTADITLTLENGGPALEADDYELQFYFNTIHQLGAVTADNQDPPFFGPGSFQLFVSEALPEGDQLPETEGTIHEVSSSEHIEFEAPYDWETTPTYLEAMISDDGPQEMTVVVGGFSEFWVDWVDTHGDTAFLYADNTALQYAGELTITYEYSPVEE